MTATEKSQTTVNTDGLVNPETSDKPSWAIAPRSFRMDAFGPSQDDIYGYEKQALQELFGSNITPQMALQTLSGDQWATTLKRASEIAAKESGYAEEGWRRAVGNTYSKDNGGFGDWGPNEYGYFYDTDTNAWNLPHVGESYDWSKDHNPTLSEIMKDPARWSEGIGRTPLWAGDMAKTVAQYGLGYGDLSQAEVYKLMEEDPDKFRELYPKAVASNYITAMSDPSYTGTDFTGWNRSVYELDPDLSMFGDPETGRSHFDYGNYTDETYPGIPDWIKGLYGQSASTAPAVASSEQAASQAQSTSTQPDQSSGGYMFSDLATNGYGQGSGKETFDRSFAGSSSVGIEAIMLALEAGQSVEDIARDLASYYNVPYEYALQVVQGHVDTLKLGQGSNA